MGWVVVGCSDPATNIGGYDSADTKDVVFDDIFVPDYDSFPTATDTAQPSDSAQPTDSGIDAADTTLDDSAATDAVTTTDTATSGDDGDVSSETTKIVGDSAESAGETDASPVDTSPPAPFCGDLSCNGDETCLDCADCTCPEICGTDLFFSEYLEGVTGFNKALEIANFTGRPVDLSSYSIWKITNGGDWSEAKPLMLSGTLDSGAVVVVCHGDADPALLALCDLTSTSDPMQFNGNDAVGLAHNGVLVDVIGEPGDAPTGGFTVAGIANGTKDHRLTRAPTVVSGTTDWAVGAVQWAVNPPDDSGLGAHAVAATCAIQALPLAQINEVRIGGGSSDYIELAAGPETAADLSGWRIATTGGQYVFPSAATSTLAPNAILELTSEELGFGLGVVDIVWLYDAANVLQDVSAVSEVDIADGQTWGRLPDFAGPFESLSRATPGGPNEDPDHWCGDGSCQIDEDCVSCVGDCGECRALPGELVVTEVLADPTAGPEWLEVTSVSTVTLELAGLVLKDDGSDFHALAPTGGSLTIAPGERVVLGSAPAAYVDYAYSGFALDGASDAIVLEEAGQEIDRVAWTGSPTAAGVAWSLDPTSTDANDNDLPSEWCPAVDSDADAQLGTPGLANPPCTAVVACGDTVCSTPDETCTSCPGDCGPCSTCASDLFISEYVEGASFNKALEIANFTGAQVDLGQYAIWKITNDGVWTENPPLFLSGTLANGDVYVLCNSGAVAAILNVCDSASNQTYMMFNGDDAIGLAHGSTLIDTIGTEATSGAGWTVAGVQNATTDHVLVRKPSVSAPTTDWMSSSANEWDVHGPAELNFLGAHTVDYTCP
ncbi:MAG: lamin tail domain-containing protein [Myxococcota bacterium]